MEPCPAETRSHDKSVVAGHMSVEMRLHRVHTCESASLMQVQLHAAVLIRNEISLQSRASLDTCHLRCAYIVCTLVHLQLSTKAVAYSRVQPRRDLVQSRVSLDTFQSRCACIICTLVHVHLECKCSCMQPCSAEMRSCKKLGIARHMSVEMRLHRLHTCACAV